MSQSKRPEPVITTYAPCRSCGASIWPYERVQGLCVPCAFRRPNFWLVLSFRESNYMYNGLSVGIAQSVPDYVFFKDRHVMRIYSLPELLYYRKYVGWLVEYAGKRTSFYASLNMEPLPRAEILNIIEKLDEIDLYGPNELCAAEKIDNFLYISGVAAAFPDEPKIDVYDDDNMAVAVGFVTSGRLT